MSTSLTVLTPVDPATLPDNTDTTTLLISEKETANDALDQFNHPRLRRALILKELVSRQATVAAAAAVATGTITVPEISFVVPSEPLDVDRWKELYGRVHSPGLLEFLSTGWKHWSEYRSVDGKTEQVTEKLISSNVPLMRLDGAHGQQRVPKNPIGQMGYYCQDVDTPLFADLLAELLMDGKLVQEAVNNSSASLALNTVVYTMVTHPGHHAARDCFGGYCYVNHVAAMARLFQSSSSHGKRRVAILDVDYHVGNGTASIFYNDPTVFVASLHCDPDYEYPFHSGFADETGTDGDAKGTTMHLPLPPGSTWETTYRPALERALAAITRFVPQVLLVSMGLDTHDQDPVCVRRAGFHLQGDDYVQMGLTLAQHAPSQIPVVFLQEGGYRMDKIAAAASNVVTSFCQARHNE